MNEIREWIREMDREEKIQAVEACIAWAGLLFMGFMLSIVAG